MQSVQVARVILNGVALMLALSASSQRAWSVVEPALPYWHNAQSARDLANSPTADLHFTRLTFAPNEYCLDFRNGSSDCNPYAFLLTHNSVAPLNLTALDGGLDPHYLFAAASSNRLQSAVSSWCIGSASSSSSSSSTKPDSAWLLQGAQSMLCLVVLETCVYTSLLWYLFGISSVVFSLCTLFGASRCEGCAGFTTFAQTALGALVLLEWWGYSSHMADLGLVAVLQLVVHYGVSVWYAALATASSLVACRLSMQISSPHSTFHLAKLHALPQSHRSERDHGRRRAHHPSSTSSRSSNTNDENVPLACLDEAMDPLQCPANYVV